MRMSFIGAGKVGTALGIYFKNNGFMIEGYYSKSSDSTHRASLLTESKAFKNLDELMATTDFIWITVNDDALEEVDTQLATVEVPLEQLPIIAHTSGAHSSNILKNLKQKGYRVYSIHPLQAFNELSISIETLKSTVFTLEGETKDMEQIFRIFERTHNAYFVINEQSKTLYHAGACVLSNYLVTLMDVGFNLLEQAGLKRDEIFEAFEPLIMGTLGNIKAKDPKQALTGPISRGDVKTLSKHVKALEQHDPSALAFYQSMGLKTISMLETSHQNIKNEAAMKEILKGVIKHE